MPDFDYLALDVAGRERRGQVRGQTAEEARTRLAARKLYPVRVEPARAVGEPLVAKGLHWRRNLSAKQLVLFTRQLATLAQVAPLEEALRTIARQTESVVAAQVLTRVHSGVLEGRRLSDAMGREEASFPPLYRAMVAAGEASGTLPAILDRLANLLERQAQVRAKVLTALAYPLVLAVVAVGVVIALMMFVVPQVVAQFDDIGQTLPFLTRMVIGLSGFLRGWWWAILIALACFGVAGGQAMRDERLRLALDRRLLRAPGLGRLIRDLNAARLARTLATMVASRLPLMEGLDLTTRTVRNRALRQASVELVEAIRGGGSLSTALRRTGLFPPLLVTMAASGEASGRLDVMLERAADYLEREFDAFTATALSLLEPAIIVLMGGMVAMIVLSILLPILQLDTLAGAV